MASLPFPPTPSAGSIAARNACFILAQGRNYSNNSTLAKKIELFFVTRLKLILFNYRRGCLQALLGLQP